MVTFHKNQGNWEKQTNVKLKCNLNISLIDFIPIKNKRNTDMHKIAITKKAIKK